MTRLECRQQTHIEYDKRNKQEIIHPCHNRTQIAREAVRLRIIHEKLSSALASVAREFRWADDEENTPEECALWASRRQAADASLASWLKNFMTAIRNLELGLMFDEADSIKKAVSALPPAKTALFANIKNLLAQLKREDC